MPTNDNTSSQRAIIAANLVITSNTTTTGIIVDTAKFDPGIMMAPQIVEFSAGSFAFSLTESDDSGMSGETNVTGDNLIFPPGVTTLPTLTALSADNVSLSRFGFFSTKRFVRIAVVSTGASGDNRILVNAIEMAELSPVA